MRLNRLSPGKGSKKAAKRVGRGIGSTLGKTCGRGHKGQKSRAGGGVKPGFEGGQMPLQRRLPKVGFRSRSRRFVDEVRLSEIDRLDADVIDLAVLKQAGLVARHIKTAKVILSGEINRPVTIQGLPVTKGAKAAIEAAGGKVA